MSNTITTAIEKGLTYLARTQRPSGEFATYTSSQPDMAGATERPKTIYTTTFVIHSLSCLPPNPLITPIQQRAGDFLAGEQEDNGAWHYESIYSVSPHFPLYALSRACADGRVSDLAPATPVTQDYILTQLPPHSAEPAALHLACLAAALLNLQADLSLLEPYITALLARQKNDGHWPAWGAYWGYQRCYDGAHRPGPGSPGQVCAPRSVLTYYF